MSGAAKTRHTEIIVKQGKDTAKFKVSLDVGRNLRNLLGNLDISRDEETVPAEEIFPDLKDPVKRIGIVFRGIRFKNNLTQAEVAERLGLDQSDVSKIEKGKRPIGKALAKKIQREFGMDYRRFL